MRFLDIRQFMAEVHPEFFLGGLTLRVYIT
jgi:hypothetical protein